MEESKRHEMVESPAKKKMEMDKERQTKMHKVMAEYKRGTLLTSSGKKVVDREQAIAIAMSEARRA